MFGQLGGRGGFTCALQTCHQDHSGRLGGQIDVSDALAHGGGQLLVDNAHQRLTRFERAHDLLTQCLVFHTGNEIAHHRQGHVGLQQSHAHVTQHVRDIGFGDAGLSTDLFDEFGKFVGKGGGHGCHLQKISNAKQTESLRQGLKR